MYQKKESTESQSCGLTPLVPPVWRRLSFVITVGFVPPDSNVPSLKTELEICFEKMLLLT